MTITDVALALLTAALSNDDPALTVPVFDGWVPPDPPRRYAVLYGDATVVASVDVGNSADDFTWNGQVTSVGGDRREAEWIAQRSRDALVNHRPAVDGLACEPFRHTESQPVRADDDVPDRVVMYGTDQYAVGATKA